MRMSSIDLKRVFQAPLVAAKTAIGLVVMVLTALMTYATLFCNRRVESDVETGYSVLIVDASYTLDQIRARGLEAAVTSRDCGGLFEHVWSVHPLVGAELGENLSSPMRVTEVCPNHTFVETSVNGGRGSSNISVLGFAASQERLHQYFRTLFRTRTISVVRVGDPYYLGLIGLLLARSARLPLVVRIPGNSDLIYESTGQLAYPRLLRRRWIERRVLRFVLTRADMVLAPSRNNLEFGISNGAVPEHSVVVRYGNLIHPIHFSDPSGRLSVRAELGISNRPLIAMVSRLEPVKLVFDVVDVLRRVLDEFPDTACCLVGDGSQWSDLEDATEVAGIRDRLLLVGNRPQEWIARLMADADVLLATCLGRALVESSLSGTPIVAYDYEWHTELLTNDLTGLIVPVGATARMAEAVATLIGDRQLANEIATRARTRTLKIMKPETIANRERACIEELLGSRTVRGRSL